MKGANLFIVLLLGLWIMGCKKFEDDYHGQIWSNNDYDVTLDFYASKDDYSNNRNVVKSLLLPAHGKVDVPREFETGQKLYLDWYSQDYTNTNWGVDPTFTVASITKEIDPAITIQSRSTPARRIWLDGNKTATSWKAFNAFYSTSSNWPWMTEGQKNRRFTVRKSMTGTYTYSDQDGVEQTMEFTCFSGAVSGPTVFVSMFLSFGASSSVYNIVPATNGPVVYSDTVFTPKGFPPSYMSSYMYFYYKLPQ